VVARELARHYLISGWYGVEQDELVEILVIHEPHVNVRSNDGRDLCLPKSILISVAEEKTPPAPKKKKEAKPGPNGFYI